MKLAVTNFHSGDESRSVASRLIGIWHCNHLRACAYLVV
jgi:hypothetical protein